MSTEDTPTFPPLTQIPPDGIYRVMNASTGTFLDMRGGLSAENNPVVGWAGNEESKNQQWQLSATNRDKGEFNLKNVASNTFVRAPLHAVDKKVVGSSHAETFILREQATGKFRIQVGDQTLAFYLDRNENDVQVVLQDMGDSAKQQWIFVGV